MKISRQRGHSRAAGFTLAELMIALAVFGLVIAAMVSSQILGLRMYRITDAKLRVAADARRVMNQVRDEIWSAKLLYVGNGTGSSFTSLADNEPRAGSALKICPTADTNSFVCYFFDAKGLCLKRQLTNGPVQIIARNVTNEIVFRAEDFAGNTVSNYLNNRVINITLQMRKPEWAGSMYEFYQLQTRVTRRAID